MDPKELSHTSVPELAVDSSYWGLEHVVTGLRAARDTWRIAQQRRREFGLREFPSRDALKDISAALCAVLFPMRLGPADLHQEAEDYYVGHTLDTALHALYKQVRLELSYQLRREGEHPNVDVSAASIVKSFAAELPSLRILLDTDVEAAYRGDPAARSVDEVLLSYPGVQAIIHHRLAHSLFKLGAPLVARIVAEISHSATGIDIHPGAQIGSGFFIDHGTGVVIGETAIIGNNVRIYQAVTLGAKSFITDGEGALQKGGARHPIVEDDVVIYAGATILGRVTIGQGSVIGGNIWLTQSIAANSIVTQNGVRYEQQNQGSGI